MEICLLLSGGQKRGQSVLFTPTVFQVLLIQNNQFAGVSYLGMMYSQPPEVSSRPNRF